MPSRRRAAGEGGLYQRADGLWVASVDIPTEDGSRKRKTVSSRDYGKAVAKLRDLRDSIEDGIIPTPSVTIEAWLTYWLEEIKRPKVRPKTYHYYEQSVRLHIIPGIGTRRLNQLTPQHVRQMLKAIPSTKNRQRAHMTLRLALKAAIKEGILRRDVTDAVDKPAHLAQKPAAFSADVSRHIIATAVREDRRMCTRWAASFLTGARPSELLGLEWDRVDLGNGLFDFAWQLQELTKVHGCGKPGDKGWPCGRKKPSYCPDARFDFPAGFEYRECQGSLVWTRPKTGAGVRIVPIHPMLQVELERLAQLAEPNPHGLVWHHPDGRPIGPRDDHQAWQALLIAAGVTTKDEPIPVYAGRHSAATLMQSYGVSEDVRMQIMGHSSAAAHRGYIHVDHAQTRAAIATLDGILELTEG